MTGAVRANRVAAVAGIVLVNVVVTVCLIEVALRVQQTFGPLYDLAPRPEILMVQLSNELNHVPERGKDWDGNGIRRLQEPNTAQCAPKLLFMGDSFMQGGDRAPDGEIVASRESDTIPYQVRHFFRERLGKEVCVFNAGYASYSPSIFVPQAKKLIPLLQPDIVIIDVDETDFWDDNYRYRQLVVRDGDGSIMAVRATPISLRFQEGLMETTSKALYLHRLLAKLYFTRITFPRVLEGSNRGRPADGFFLSKLPAAGAKEKYAAEIDYFRATVEDLTKTILSRMGSTNGLVYINHPHLEHLRNSGIVFNDVVSSIVHEVASRHGVRFCDETESLKAQFGTSPEDYYIPNDMHFNPAGTRAYGIAVAKCIAESLLPY